MIQNFLTLSILLMGVALAGVAQERVGRVSNVQIRLSSTLVPHAPATAGVETIRFVLSDANSPLLLDFRDGDLKSSTINNKPSSSEHINGHIVLPSAALQHGPNSIEIRFAAKIGTAEKAIKRFEDHDDASEYLYTLFVPMDVEMAFPCFDQPDLKT